MWNSPVKLLLYRWNNWGLEKKETACPTSQVEVSEMGLEPRSVWLQSSHSLPHPRLSPCGAIFWGWLDCPFPGLDSVYRWTIAQGGARGEVNRRQTQSPWDQKSPQSHPLMCPLLLTSLGLSSSVTCSPGRRGIKWLIRSKMYSKSY